MSSIMALRLARKATSLAKDRSIPAPTGQFAVGCVDLMHKLEGDSDGLLMRLFYPTLPAQKLGSGYQYAKWMPHERYSRTTLEFIKVMVPGLRANAVEIFTSELCQILA